MTLTQEREIKRTNVSSVIQGVILAAFSFLTALSIRDALIKSIEIAIPSDDQKSLLFIYFFAVLILLITVTLSYVWSTTASRGT